jgi:hypothetical protein
MPKATDRFNDPNTWTQLCTICTCPNYNPDSFRGFKTGRAWSQTDDPTLPDAQFINTSSDPRCGQFWGFECARDVQQYITGLALHLSDSPQSSLI